MAFRSVLPRPVLQQPRPPRRCPQARYYATIQPVTLVGRAPGPPHAPPPTMAAPSVLDALVLSELRKARGTSLPSLVQLYEENSGTVLDAPLPYESRPDAARRVDFGDQDGVVMIAHAMQHGDAHKVALCSGFALSVSPRRGEAGKETADTVVLTCAHTLEEMRSSALFASTQDAHEARRGRGSAISTSGSFVLTPSPSQHAPAYHPVQHVLSALHRPDLLLLSSRAALRTLPVSPYPAQPGSSVRAHIVLHRQPPEGEDGWRPWVGGTWSKWVRGTVLGYRDFAGREAKPGTYDALSHMLFEPLPTPGSSGGPIVDEESGAVVGVMLGTRMDSRVEGVRGWGAPAETIFEMFSLPGLRLGGR